MELTNQILSLSLPLGSIMLNIIVIFYLIERKTSYSQLMRKIMMYECLLLYSRAFSLWKNTDEKNIFTDITEAIKSIIDLLFNTDKGKYDNMMEKMNNSISMSSECVLFLFNSFLCYELISSIKHPISQKKNRIIMYDIIGFGIISIILLFYIIESERYSLFLFITGYLVILLLFLAFVVIGVLSIIFLVIHFYKESNATHDARKLFVIKHMLYVIVYLFSFSFMLINTSIALFNTKFDYSQFIKVIHEDNENHVLKIALHFNSSIGIILFPIRLLETQLLWNWRCSCINNYNMLAYDSNHSEKKRNTAHLLSGYITRNINLEMICCILYGMNKMFRRNSRGSSNKIINESDTNSFSSSSSSDQERKILTGSIEEAKAHKIKYKPIFNANRNMLSRRKTLTSRILTESQITLVNNGDDESELFKSFDIKDIQQISKDNDAIIIEYYPYIFNVLRSKDDITNDMIKESLNPDNNLDFFQSLVESKGRSGSFFFFSSDNKFIIKTMSSSELKTINKGFLIDYYNHLINYSDTLIAKIYGIYTIVINEISMIHVILMQNLVNCKSENVKYIFDIKGSTFQRKTDYFENRSNLSPLKDLDFLWMKRVDNNLVSLGDDVYSEILTRIEIDTDMLSNNNLMDYSLLFVIIELPDEKDEDYLDIISILGDRRYCSKTFKSKNMNYMYVLGIIDYLQEFNYYKQLELKYKSVLYWKDKMNVSVQPPDVYAKRFVEFIKSNFR